MVYCLIVLIRNHAPRFEIAIASSVPTWHHADIAEHQCGIQQAVSQEMEPNSVSLEVPLGSNLIPPERSAPLVCRKWLRPKPKQKEHRMEKGNGK
jgi:hypothetical protein